jgi:transposase-like protein
MTWLQAMGMTGISKSQVSRPCGEIDEKVKGFLHRPIEGRLALLWIDATYVKVRQNGRVDSVAVIIAVGVNGDGRREILGLDVGPSEAETFWTGFLPQDDAAAARAQWRKIVDQLRPKLPKLAAYLNEAEADVLAYMTFPAQEAAVHKSDRASQRRDQATRTSSASSPTRMPSSVWSGRSCSSRTTSGRSNAPAT